MSEFIELPDGSRIELVRVGDLKVDDYQRGDRSSANQVRDHFDPRLLEVLAVSRRWNGRTFLIDGKQRMTGLKARFGEDYLVFARIFEGLTVADEVFLFEKLNKGHVTVSAYDIFKAQLFAGEPEAVALNEAVISVDNLVIRPRHGRDAVGSTSELVKMAKWTDVDGLKILQEALITLRHAYPNQDLQLNGAILLGVTRLLREMHRQGIYTRAWQGSEDLAHRLKKYRYTANAEIAFSSAQSAAKGGGATLGSGRAALSVFIQAWNSGRDKGDGGNRMKLPEE